MTLIPTLKISHCFREANACADGLAKASSRGGQDFVLLETPPVEIIQLLFKDSSGSVCTRLCSDPAAFSAG